MNCSTAGFPVHHQLPELVQTHVYRVGDAIQPSHPVIPFSSCLQSYPASESFPMNQFFALGDQNIGSFSFSISPCNEYLGLISFRIDWFDLLVVQGTLKSLLQQHGSKASILLHSAFFIVQLSHPYITSGKTIILTTQTCKEIKPVHPKGTLSWIFFRRADGEAETPTLWPPHVKSWLIGKDFDAGRDWGQEEKGMTKDEMAGWHHWLNGRESEWTPGVGDGQRGLACCNSWGRKESNTTERLN